MIVRDANPYVACTFGGAASHFVRLCLENGAIRFAQNCARAVAVRWREERTRRERLALFERYRYQLRGAERKSWAAELDRRRDQHSDR
jgi:hypothetical protein